MCDVAAHHVLVVRGHGTLSTFIVDSVTPGEHPHPGVGVHCDQAQQAGFQALDLILDSLSLWF